VEKSGASHGGSLHFFCLRIKWVNFGDFCQTQIYDDQVSVFLTRRRGDRGGAEDFNMTVLISTTMQYVLLSAPLRSLRLCVKKLPGYNKRRCLFSCCAPCQPPLALCAVPAV